MSESSHETSHAVVWATYAGVALAVSLIVSWYLARGIAPPLRALSGQLGDLASGGGDLTRRITVRSRDEIGELALEVDGGKVIVRRCQGR